MNTIAVNYPVAPQMVMNAVGQDIALISGAIGMLVCLVIGWRMSVRFRTPLPFLFPIAGLFDVVLEPVICWLGHCIHPQIGQLTLFETNSRPIPVHIALLYGVYYGPVWLYLFHRVMTQGFTGAFLWKTYGVLFACAFVFTLAPVHYGMWYHYGYQALRLWEGGSPLFFPFTNLVPAFLGFALILHYRHTLTGIGSLLVIPLSQIAAFMGHLGAGFPYYNVINSSAGPAAIQLAGIASVLLGLMIVGACNQSLVASSRQIQRSNPRGSNP